MNYSKPKGGGKKARGFPKARGVKVPKAGGGGARPGSVKGGAASLGAKPRVGGKGIPRGK